MDYVAAVRCHAVSPPVAVAGIVGSFPLHLDYKSDGGEMKTVEIPTSSKWHRRLCERERVALTFFSLFFSLRSTGVR